MVRHARRFAAASVINKIRPRFRHRDSFSLEGMSIELAVKVIAGPIYFRESREQWALKQGSKYVL
jgi:hypothetical protein